MPIRIQAISATLRQAAQGDTGGRRIVTLLQAQGDRRERRIVRLSLSKPAPILITSFVNIRIVKKINKLWEYPIIKIGDPL